MRKGLVFLAVLLALLMISPVASHRVHTSWEIDKIELKAWYGGGEPMENAEVKVFINQSGERVVYQEGVTDENGVFAFSPKTGVGNYTAVIGSAGHKGDVEIDLGSSSSSGEEQELPLYMRIGAGLGYLLGLAGVALAYTGWKKSKREEK